MCMMRNTNQNNIVGLVFLVFLTRKCTPKLNFIIWKMWVNIMQLKNRIYMITGRETISEKLKG